MAIRDEDAVRGAALAWVRQVTLDCTVPISREQLARDFVLPDGTTFALVDPQRGIRKPAGWRAALSILTVATRAGETPPYADHEGPDGLQRYKFRRDERGAAENEALRAALRWQVPIMWFVGLAPGVYQAIAPVYVVAEEEDQFALALTESQRLVQANSPVEETLRRYILAETKRRLHQPVFAYQVMRAYAERCAVCRLGHHELLDAAHIIADTNPGGLPVVPNGLALCKLHHAAFDRNILGIRPDYVVEIHYRLLAEIDGPMLRHGLQEHHNQRLLQVPTRRAELPDPIRLEERYAQFRAA